MFFIRYNVPPPSGERAGDLAALARHPNGANAMSSVWLLSADLDGDKARLERLGFEAAGRVELASVNATGLRFRAANEAILLLEPSGKGLAAEALAKRGPHVFGISVAVDDLGRAERIVARGTGLPLVRAAGSHGEGFFVPLHETLGLSIEFHQSR